MSRPTCTYPEITVSTSHAGITDSSSLMAQLTVKSDLSYDLIDRWISVQSFVDGRTMIGNISPRPFDARQDATRAPATHLSRVSDSVSSSSL